MKSFDVDLKGTVANIKEFCSICSSFAEDINVESYERSYIIDAKSIMGLFSIDTSKKVKVVIYTENDSVAKKLKEALAKFVA